MCIVIYILELLLDELRIHVRGGYIGVAEHFLYRVYICAVLEQMCGKGVAQRVRGDILVDVRLFLLVFDDLPEALTAHTLTGDSDEQ